MRNFKILKSYNEKRKDIPEFFPWHLLDEANAKRFHSQTLESLNERGGLAVEEIYCNITGTEYHKQKFDHDKTVDWIHLQIKNGVGLGKDNGILPCPFCNSPEGENVILGYEYQRFRITCVPCSVTMAHDRKDKVIGFWNNRIYKPD